MNDKKYFFIINPVSGAAKSWFYWLQLKQMLITDGLNFGFAKTTHKNHARQLVQEAVMDGFNVIVGLGGDGTNNEIINGLFSIKNINFDNIEYSFFSCGTGNDWVKSIGLSRDLDEWYTVLKEGNIKRVSIGEVIEKDSGTKHYFANVAGMCYDAFVVKKLEEANFKNKIFYFYYIFKCLFQYTFQKTKVSTSQKQYEGEYYTINIGIGKYSGGGMQFVPHANPFLDKFAITLVKAIPKWEVLRQTPLFYSGKLCEYKHAITFHTDSIEIRSNDESKVLLELDGEYIGEGHYSFEILPQVLKIIC